MEYTLEEAIDALKRGEVIGVPTDTVYGLSSMRAYSDNIYCVKNRDKEKKLVTMIYESKILNITDKVLLSKMEKVWPGAVTLIFDYDNEMTSFRIPDEPNLLELLRVINEPIYTTSANLSGEEPCLTREQFIATFPHIGLLKETIEIEKSSVPSEIYIYEQDKFERIR